GPVGARYVTQPATPLSRVEPRAPPGAADLIRRQLELEVAERLEDCLSHLGAAPGLRQVARRAALPAGPVLPVVRTEHEGDEPQFVRQRNRQAEEVARLGEV